MDRYQLEGDSLRVDVADGIATLTMNRPAQMNCLSRQLRNNLLAALREVSDDSGVDVIILTGAGNKAFSAGADLKELEQAPLQPEEMGVDCPVMRAFESLQKPIIAAINGYTVAGGFELAVNCDILVASTNARFADTHCRVGIVPAWGLTQYLTMLIGPVRARYLSFTGNYLEAAIAKEWGLVLDVVAPEQLLPYCRKLAQDIISCDRWTIRNVRSAMRVGLQQSIHQGLLVEADFAKESVRRFDASAFGAKRKAVMNRGKRQIA